MIALSTVCFAMQHLLWVNKQIKTHVSLEEYKMSKQQSKLLTYTPKDPEEYGCNWFPDSNSEELTIFLPFLVQGV